MDSTNNFPIFMETPELHLHLPIAHAVMRTEVDMLLDGHAGSRSISTYFAGRTQHEGAVKQDLLPLLVYEALGAEARSRSLPLVVAWALNLAAAHLVDEAQDQGKIDNVHHSLLAMGAAGLSMAELDVDEHTLRDLLEAMNRVTMLAVEGQRDEWKQGRLWCKEAYFRAVAGKSAAIIAAGVWLGGRLVTSDSAVLTALKEFGLALGMAIQISDDYLDLAEDLQNGTFTLPVIEGLDLTDHKAHKTLVQMLSQPALSPGEAQHVMSMLAEMGVMASCHRIIRAYQIQAAAAFVPFPGLEVYFNDYVTASEH
ncbi:MAG: polyprenyl synthetase family protein [Chloroflexota bacterium]